VLAGAVAGPVVCALTPTYVVTVQMAGFLVDVIEGDIPLAVAPLYNDLTVVSR
jgi:hypothetical protein